MCPRCARVPGGAFARLSPWWQDGVHPTVHPRGTCAVGPAGELPLPQESFLVPAAGAAWPGARRSYKSRALIMSSRPLSEEREGGFLLRGPPWDGRRGCRGDVGLAKAACSPSPGTR